MLIHPGFDPVALHLPTIGPLALAIHWYGLMYLLGFLSFYWLGRYRAKKTQFMSPDAMGDLVFYGALGVMLGGRFGYVLFYDFQNFLHNPLLILGLTQTVSGHWSLEFKGMSFHGGLIGIVTAMVLFARHHQLRFTALLDFVTPLGPLGLFFGRIGNFINGELWGRPTNASWGMVFPWVDNQARHPSMLYESFLEGLVLFLVLWWFSREPKPRLAVTGLFLLGYGVFRFLIEFVREPDQQIGFIAFDWMTMGHLLSLPMIIAGGSLLVWAYTQNTLAARLERK
ncbi:MAG: prolipoprotein diacylglyceryl transferase [Gammaproteobacteria bacterium]|nr:prolipoprotein diacylglyceryl transferase [Gammaproteobacteria bacterium]